MEQSKVFDDETGKAVLSSERTSSGAFLARGSDEIVTNIEKRIADFTFIPVEHGEDLQVLHYEVGQKYVPHHDFFTDKLNINIAMGGQRIATMLMYLSDVEEGGETVFPVSKENFSSVPWWNELSACGKQGLSIKPKMGDALLFWSLNPDATYDLSSLHGSCPVIKVVMETTLKDDVGEETVKTTSLGAAHQLLGQQGCSGDDENEAHSTQG
ncbi:hypothetical protein Fmac_015065 [Flemingia macrophylla]|uniref:Fe2OG dioxygenase domain-containing protein n=1 Tax=Flemingia macrophylla TaxID=520843 RepID=A0ABD1MDH7_9FABA